MHISPYILSFISCIILYGAVGQGTPIPTPQQPCGLQRINTLYADAQYHSQPAVNCIRYPDILYLDQFTDCLGCIQGSIYDHIEISVYVRSAIRARSRVPHPSSGRWGQREMLGNPPPYWTLEHESAKRQKIFKKSTEITERYIIHADYEMLCGGQGPSLMDAQSRGGSSLFHTQNPTA